MQRAIANKPSIASQPFAEPQQHARARERRRHAPRAVGIGDVVGQCPVRIGTRARTGEGRQREELVSEQDDVVGLGKPGQQEHIQRGGD